MSDMEPGPCDNCGEDLEIHTQRQLEQCVLDAKALGSDIIPPEQRRERWPTPEEFCFDWYNMIRAEQLEKADQIVMALSHFANCPRTWDRVVDSSG